RPHRAPRSTLFPYTTLFRSLIGPQVYICCKKELLGKRIDRISEAKAGKFQRTDIQNSSIQLVDYPDLTSRSGCRVDILKVNGIVKILLVQGVIMGCKSSKPFFGIGIQ